MKDLSISCGGCGTCCHEILPPVTHLDVRRIIKHTGLPAKKFVRLYSDQEIDLEADSKNWVKMKGGKRVLAMLQPKGRCVFLRKDNRCTVYKARPMTCRGYPFSVNLDQKLKITGIDCHRSTKDTFACNALAIPVKRGHMVGDTIREEKEDKAYWKKCDEWNTGTRDRTFNEFLSFMGLLVR